MNSAFPDAAGLGARRPRRRIDDLLVGRFRPLGSGAQEMVRHPARQRIIGAVGELQDARCRINLS